MAWTAPRTWVTAEVVTASNMNTHVRDNFLETAPFHAATVSGYFVVNGTNSIAQRVPKVSLNDTDQSTASTTYTDLATAGPAIGSITTGTDALIIVTCRMRNDTAGGKSFAGYTVTGASSITASDLRALEFESDSTDQTISASFSHLQDGLTAGVNTFTMKYRVSAGTSFFRRRYITVFPY